ncbi:WD repeat protein Swd3 [Schizosaccharomyces japonicus yFS275]|uniref:WD repeat protein Swd3 n=1 Tax=Schizosaccharomyces japonicus (strain yFS275 / FY16936) TaxID=402676 RepID=B6K263_SCHJY|nr:WD repeat protein Swd3 [Schizosaccharomyces japonicus yFS275]EEB07244.1 WD repeat protein Swd3 [Schizosaccharomyces japonicus yFS275]
MLPPLLLFMEKGHDEYHQVLYLSTASPNKRWLATASSDGVIKIWYTRSFSLECTLYGHTAGVSQVAWSCDSKLLVSASDDKTIRVWNVENGKCERVLRGHTNYVLCVDFNHDGNLIVSGSWDETVKIWNVQEGSCLRTLPAHSEPVTAVSFSHDSTLLATASYDGMARIWDVPTGQCLKTLVEPVNVPLAYATFTPNSRYLLVSNLNSEVRLWDYRTGHLVRLYKTFPCQKYSLQVGFLDKRAIPRAEQPTHSSISLSSLISDQSTVAEDADGTSQVTSSDIHATSSAPNATDAYLLLPSEDGRVSIVDASTKRVIDDSIHVQPPHPILCVASLGPFVMTASMDTTVRVWIPSHLQPKPVAVNETTDSSVADGMMDTVDTTVVSMDIDITR